MVLEILGKKSRNQTVFTFILLTGLLLPLIAVFGIYRYFSQNRHLREEILLCQNLAAKSYPDRMLKKGFIETYANDDPQFLTNQLEKLPLLVKEKETLLALSSTSILPQKEKRREFLESNHLSFTEEKIWTSSNIKETEVAQEKRVEIDGEDLKKILSLIEGVDLPPFSPPKGRPQLIITDFQLEKMKDSNHFKLLIRLLKREFTL